MAHVQTVIGTQNAGTGNSCTAAGATIGVGNTVVGFARFRDSVAQGTVSVTDDKSNTYIVSAVANFVIDFIWMFRLDNIVNSPTTITAKTTETAANVNFFQCSFSEYSGVKFDTWTSPPNAVTAPGTGTDAITSGNITTSGNGNTIWGCTSKNGSADTIAVGTGYTLRGTDTTNWWTKIEDKPQATHGSVAATFTDPTDGGSVSYPTGAISLTPKIFAAGIAGEVPNFPGVRVKAKVNLLAAISKQDEQWPFTATPNPLKMQGIYYDPQFPQRIRQDPRQARGDEQWPFTAVPTPQQFGWDNPEKFPQRIRFRPKSTLSDEQWPFTAVKTPTQFGWDNPERFSQRLRFRPSQSADEQWPFTAVPTPGPLGWQVQDPLPVRRRAQLFAPTIDVVSPQQATQTPTGLEWAWDPQFPQRIRFRTFQSSDEQWPFTSVVTADQFGWQLDPQFPLRIRFRTFQQADEQWPFTATGTPAQFGWHLDPQFAIRRRFRTFQSADEQWAFTSVPTPSAFGFAWDPQFPFRIRFRPLTLNDEQWSFTATPTPTQFGWHLEPQVAIRARFRPQLAQFDVTTFTPGTLTPTNLDFAYPPEFFPVRQRFRPLIHETFNPRIPIASPTFQTMQAGATKVKLNTGATFVTINLQGTGAFVFSPIAAPTILNEALPFGSAHVVLTAGSTPVSVALAASNDGVNFVQVGPAVTFFPSIINLTALPLLSTVPYAYHAWIVTGGDATTQLTITEIFTGWRG